MPQQTGYSEAFIPSVAAGIGFAGAVVGSVLTVILIEWQKKRERPLLVVEFEPTERYLASSTYLVDQTPVTSKYLRVGLENRGRSVAQNCRLYLVSIELVSASGIGPDQLHDARQLSWPPNSNFDARTLPSGLRMIVNVALTDVGKRNWRFQLQHDYGIGNNVKQCVGQIRLGIMATADNAEPVKMYILANLKADGEGFDARQE